MLNTLVAFNCNILTKLQTRSFLAAKCLHISVDFTAEWCRNVALGVDRLDAQQRVIFFVRNGSRQPLIGSEDA